MFKLKLYNLYHLNLFNFDLYAHWYKKQSFSLDVFLDNRVLKNEFLIESNSKRLIARRKLTVIGFCERFKKKGSQRLTVTGLANFGFTPILWRPQGPQGCLGEQNYPLSSNLVVWCAKIGLKTKEVRKTSEVTNKMSIHFFKVSWFWIQF